MAKYIPPPAAIQFVKAVPFRHVVTHEPMGFLPMLVDERGYIQGFVMSGYTDNPWWKLFTSGEAYPTEDEALTAYKEYINNTKGTLLPIFGEPLPVETESANELEDWFR